jgi:hypothetical protein
LCLLHLGDETEQTSVKMSQATEKKNIKEITIPCETSDCPNLSDAVYSPP